LNGNDTELLAFIADEPNLASANALIDAEILTDVCLLVSVV
jgi:hypothetical protein